MFIPAFRNAFQTIFRSTIWLSICASLVLLSANPPTHAARDLVTSANPAAGHELIVLEVPGCIYCNIFRRDVLPAYARSKHAEDLPIRFLDLNDPAADAIFYSHPVTIVPTVILIKDNREVSRIPGYVGRENFFRLVNVMMGER